MDAYRDIEIFLQTVAEVLDLQKPIYEFSFEAVAVGPSRNAQAEAKSVSLLEGGGWGGFEVDRWADLSRLPFAEATARTVLCLQVLEHLADPVQTMQEIERILAPGGLLVVVGRSAHGEKTPGEADDSVCVRSQETPAEEHSLWRWTPTGLARLLAFFPASLIAWRGSPCQPHTLYGLAKKAPVEQFFWERFARLAQMLPERCQFAPTQKTKGTWVEWFRRLLGQRKSRSSPQPKRAETRGPREELSLVYTFPVTRERL